MSVRKASAVLRRGWPVGMMSAFSLAAILGCLTTDDEGNVIRIELVSVQFTSDHEDAAHKNLLKDNKKNWLSTGNRYQEPEWQKDPAANYPITHTKNSNVSIEVMLNISGNFPQKQYELTGDGPDFVIGGATYRPLDFSATGTIGSGQGQKITMTSQGQLPNEIGSRSGKISWQMKWGEDTFDLDESGTHTIYVTYGTPYPAADLTERRIAWCTSVPSGRDTLNEIALAIAPKVVADTKFRFGRRPPTPTPIWNALQDNAANAVDCIEAAMVARAALRLLGVPNVDIDHAYPTGAKPPGDRDASRAESDQCPTHRRVQLRYAERRPPKSQVNPGAGGSYLNNFEGNFKVRTGPAQYSHYTVYPTSGPHAGLLEVLDSIRNKYAGFGQWWSYSFIRGGKEVRWHDRDSFPNEAALPRP